MLPFNSFGTQVRNSFLSIKCTLIYLRKITRRKLIRNKFTWYNAKTEGSFKSIDATSLTCHALVMKYILAINLREYIYIAKKNTVLSILYLEQCFDCCMLIFMHACACKKIEFTYDTHRIN